MSAAGADRPGTRSATIVLVLAGVAAVSAVAVNVLSWIISHTVQDSGDWIALFLPVVAIDAVVTAVGVPRALAGLRRDEPGERTRWQLVCALVLFAVATAAVVVALWLFTHRNAPAGFEI